MQHMNKALMAKLGWKMLTDRNKLWVRVLQSKSMKGTPTLLKSANKRVASNAWRGIVSARDVLTKGVRGKITNGGNMMFWRHLAHGHVSVGSGDEGNSTGGLL